MIVNREEMLQKLELLTPGLSKQDIIEQSSCFVVAGKQVHTFNDNVACTHSAKGLPWQGAVDAEKLLQFLRLLKEKSITMEVTDKSLMIRGKRRRAAIRIWPEVVLPIETVEQPKGWHKLPSQFIQGVRLVQACASGNDNNFELTCVHITRDFIEACDACQIARYKMELPIQESVLVRRDSIRHVLTLDVSEVAETSAWIHFRGATGVVLSCRRFVEDYQDMNDILNTKGDIVVLPKNVKTATDWASCYSQDGSDNIITVQLRPGKMRVRSEGSLGWADQVQRVKYNGPPLDFGIPPEVLNEVVMLNPQCQVTTNRLRLTLDKAFTYVTALNIAQVVKTGKEKKRTQNIKRMVRKVGKKKSGMERKNDDIPF